MEMREYLDILSSQIRCKKARPMIVEEIENHIEDQAEAYKAEGMEEEKALEKAVLEMGDPVEAGVALDRVHRPKMQWELVILTVLLSLIGLLVQITIFKGSCIGSEGNAIEIRNSYIQNAVINMLVSFLIMAVMCAIDYTFLAKHPIALWWGSCILLFFYYFIYGWRMLMRNAFPYYMITLIVPVFAAIVFQYRGKKIIGMLKCIGLLAVMGLVLFINHTSISGMMEMAAAVLLILTVAILKGWFGGRKAGKMALIWVPALGIPAVLTAAAFRANENLRILAEYQAARIRAMFDQTEPTYQVMAVREQLDKMTMFGTRELPLTVLPSIQYDYIVTSMFTYFGAAFTILVLCVVAYFVWKVFHISFRQKNQLGFIISISCGGLLLIKSLNYLISNLGFYSVFSQMSMPFLSYGLGNAIVNGVLVGLLLSVYRNTNIISEKNIRPRYVFRLPIQKV
ncbi:MAG: FtsW/RodA/SpoVE family cell cycle protein [Lachnospiraceae bacterium]|nr:FtsW/RodA/SpoVE family cell cycle protein [Lachnospiraceae bacterium]